MCIYFCFMKHKSVFVNVKKKIRLKIENILPHVFLQSRLDVNTDRPVNIQTQCDERIGVLCIVVFFSMQTYVC